MSTQDKPLLGASDKVVIYLMPQEDRMVNCTGCIFDEGGCCGASTFEQQAGLDCSRGYKYMLEVEP